MDTLHKLFLSRARSEVLRLLFGLGVRERHVRALERESGLTIGAIREELKKLQALDLVVARRDGNRLYFSANSGHPLCENLREIVLKTSGLSDILRQALQKAPIEVAFVFGSVARQAENGTSDIDLLVIGRVGLRELSRLLMGVTERIGRELNIISMQRGEFRRRAASGDAFLKDVMTKPKLFILGGPRDLEAVE